MLEARAHFPAWIRREAVGFVRADVERTYARSLVEIDGRRERWLGLADQDRAGGRLEIDLGRPGEGRRRGAAADETRAVRRGARQCTLDVVRADGQP